MTPEPTTRTTDDPGTALSALANLGLLPSEAPVPDDSGHFGVFGGRFVPEALIAALDELAAAYAAARTDPVFLAELDRLARSYTGRPTPLTEVPRFATGWGGRRAHRAQARGPQPHRLAQDQQRPGPGAAHRPDGQDAGHRRDRRRPARRRHGHRGRPDGPGLRGLHGPGGHPAAGAQRRPDEAARGRGRSGHRWFADAEGRHQRGHARLGDQRRGHPLPARHRRRPPPVPADGPRLPPGHRRRGASPGARSVRAAAGCRGGLRRRGVQRHRHLPPVPRRSRGRPARVRGGRRGCGDRAPCSDDHGRLHRGPARHALVPAPGRRRPDDRVALHLRGPGLPRCRPGACLAGPDRPRPVPPDHGRGGDGCLRPAVPHRGHHPGHRERARPGGCPAAWAATWGPTDWSW